jgi:hypothetical protein
MVSDMVLARQPCSERLQAGFDLAPAMFQERRYGQLFTQAFEILIASEARAVGRDLEQDSVRLPEIETAEIEPIDRAARRQPQLSETSSLSPTT